MNYDRAINTMYRNFRHGMDIVLYDPEKKKLYEASQTVYQIIIHTGGLLMGQLHECDLETDPSDGIHNVDATLYQYIKNANPAIRGELEQVEKLGEAV